MRGAFFSACDTYGVYPRVIASRRVKRPLTSRSSLFFVETQRDAGDVRSRSQNFKFFSRSSKFATSTSTPDSTSSNVIDGTACSKMGPMIVGESRRVGGSMSAVRIAINPCDEYCRIKCVTGRHTDVTRLPWQPCHVTGRHKLSATGGVTGRHTSSVLPAV